MPNREWEYVKGKVTDKFNEGKEKVEMGLKNFKNRMLKGELERLDDLRNVHLVKGDYRVSYWNDLEKNKNNPSFQYEQLLENIHEAMIVIKSLLKLHENNEVLVNCARIFKLEKKENDQWSLMWQQSTGRPGEEPPKNPSDLKVRPPVGY